MKNKEEHLHNLWSILYHNVEIYLEMSNIFDALSTDGQNDVKDLIKNLKESDDPDDIQLSLNTLVEIFFPLSIEW